VGVLESILVHKGLSAKHDTEEYIVCMRVCVRVCVLEQCSSMSINIQ